MQKRIRAITHTDIKWTDPEYLDDLFVPWENRTVLLPYLYHTQETLKPMKLYDFKEREIWSNLLPWKAHRTTEGVGAGAEYFEVQIWKDIKNIKAIEVQEDRVLSPSLIKKLNTRGIQIRYTNWRNQPKLQNYSVD